MNCHSPDPQGTRRVPDQPASRVVGLTGGIGTGKSTVASMFEQLGAVLVDADAIVHELQAPGQPLLQQIADRFGESVIDASGALDRAALGAIVFRDADARADLGRLVHPPVRVEMQRRVDAAVARDEALVIVDIPLLFEGRRTQPPRQPDPLGLQAIILVYAPREIQIERQIRRDGADPGEAERRIDAQMSIEDKRELADFVIDNSGSLDATRRRVAEIYAELCGTGVSAS